MRAFDPLPNFNCNDPTPFPIPRERIPFWRRLVAWGCVAVLILTFVACAFVSTGQALFVWLSS